MPKKQDIPVPKRGNHIWIRERTNGKWGFSVYSANHQNDGGTSQSYASRWNARRAGRRLHPDAPIVGTVTLPRD